MRSNEERALLAVRMIWIVLAIHIIAMFVDVLQLNLLKELSRGTEVTNRAMSANDARQTYISVSYLLAYIVSGIVFIQWFRRAYFNLHILVNDLSWDESWAAGSWFIPVLNLFRPFQIMREMYRRTLMLLSESSKENNIYVSLLPVDIWWALWIINGIVNQVVFQLSLKGTEVNELILITSLSILDALISIPLAILTVRVIRDYARLEDLLKNMPPEINPA